MKSVKKLVANVSAASLVLAAGVALGINNAAAATGEDGVTQAQTDTNTAVTAYQKIVTNDTLLGRKITGCETEENVQVVSDVEKLKFLAALNGLRQIAGSPEVALLDAEIHCVERYTVSISIDDYAEYDFAWSNSGWY